MFIARHVGARRERDAELRLELVVVHAILNAYGHICYAERDSGENCGRGPAHARVRRSAPSALVSRTVRVQGRAHHWPWGHSYLIYEYLQLRPY